MATNSPDTDKAAEPPSSSAVTQTTPPPPPPPSKTPPPSITEIPLSEPKVSSEASTILVPSHSRWFSLDSIHEREVRHLPESSKNPRVYKYYRNFIVNYFRFNPNRKITFTDVHKTLGGDVDSIRRVFDFLEAWGLINYHPSSETGKWIDPKTDAESPSPTPIKETAKVICNGCKVLCTIACFVSDKYDLTMCARCFLRGNYRGGVRSSDFRRVEIWSEKETSNLLEAIARYGHDWKRVSQHVIGKTEEECVAHFLKLPFCYQFLHHQHSTLTDDADDAECESETVASAESGKKMCLTPIADASNPIMASQSALPKNTLQQVRIGPLKEKDMKSYLKKAQEKMDAKAITDAEARDIGLQKTKKSTGRGILDGSMPIPAVPVTVPSSKSTGGPSASAALTLQKADQELPGGSASKKRKTGEGEVVWSDILAEFDGEGNVTSLWDKRFPVKNFVQEQLLTQEDDSSRIESLGLEQACVALQSYALKTTALGHIIGDEFGKLRVRDRQNRKELEAAKKTLASQQDLVKEVARLKSELASQEKKFQEKDDFVKKQLEDLEVEWKEKVNQVRSEVKTHTNSIAELKIAAEQKDIEIEELKVEVATGLLKGFAQAKEQVEFLYPDVDLSEISAYKVIFEGKLVEMSSSSEDERDVNMEEIGEVGTAQKD